MQDISKSQNLPKFNQFRKENKCHLIRFIAHLRNSSVVLPMFDPSSLKASLANELSSRLS